MYASNFSIGVNIFFELNKKLAKLIKEQNYGIRLEEIHHTEKLDAPSGTAITLAEDIVENTAFQGWSLDDKKETTFLSLPNAKRACVATHTGKLSFIKWMI